MSENNVRSIYVYMASKRKPETEIENDSIDEKDKKIKVSIDETIGYFTVEMEKENKTPTPTLLILCGPPGSGKSYIKKKILEDRHISAFDIDPDEIRRVFLNSVQIKFDDYADLSKIVNKLAEDLIDKAIKLKINIVFDTTGQKFGEISKILKKSGVPEIYYTIFSVVWASFDTCQRRVILRNNQLDTERKTVPNVRIKLEPKVAADIYCKFVPSKNQKNNIPYGIASNLLLNQLYKIYTNETLLYDNNIDNREKLVFSKLPHNIANFENWSFGVNNVELDNFYDMRINKDPSPDIMHSPNDLYAEYCKLQTKSLLKSDSKNVLPPPPSVDLTSTNVLPPPPSFKTSKAKKPKTSHGAGKTKKQHKRKKRNTRKN